MLLGVTEVVSDGLAARESTVCVTSHSALTCTLFLRVLHLETMAHHVIFSARLLQTWMAPHIKMLRVSACMSASVSNDLSMRMDLFAFPSISKDLIFVTSIDETFDNTGLQILSAKKWVIN